MHDAVSAIVPPSTTAKHEYSIVFDSKLFKSKDVTNILVKSSANCTAELFITLPVAVKYPFKMHNTKIKIAEF